MSGNGVHYPFGKTHLNVKNILSIALKAPFELAMDKAMRQLNLPLEGTHHRGVDDAWISLTSWRCCWVICA